MIEAVRNAELEAGRQIAIDEASAAWGELLQAVKGDLEGLPTRVEQKAGAALKLSPEHGKAAPAPTN